MQAGCEKGRDLGVANLPSHPNSAWGPGQCLEVRAEHLDRATWGRDHLESSRPKDYVRLSGLGREPLDLQTMVTQASARPGVQSLWIHSWRLG
jgi:hypothetical protein